MKRYLVWIILAAASWTADAQAPPNAYTPPSSNPRHLHAFNGYLYFTADDGIHGNELWRHTPKTDEIELVADVTPGREGSQIDALLGAGDTLWFRRVDESGRGELWRSDGLPGGQTARVWHDPDAFANGGVKMIIGALNGRLIFTEGIQGSTHTYMAFQGAQESTIPLAEHEMAGFVADVISHVFHDGALFFGARDSSGNCGLWRSDGTGAGTRFLHRFKANPIMAVSLGTAGVLFSAETDELGLELWISQGEPENTRLLKDIYVGPEFSEPSNFRLSQVVPEGAPPIAYFSATHPDIGRELWRTDGTPEGTRLAQDIVPGRIGSSPYHIFTSQVGIYLIAYTPEMGTEIWAGHPGTGGEYLPLQPVGEGLPGPENSEPYAMCIGADDYLYYSQRGPDGEELWFAAPEPGSALQLLDINPKGNSEPYWTVRAGDDIYFSAEDPVHGRELWVNRGPSQSPVLLKDLNTDESVNPSSSPSEITPLGDLLLFAANDIEHGNELWATDETEAGTRMLADIANGPPSGNPTGITVVGEIAYFRAETFGQGEELWVTDGTPEGTAIAADIVPGVESSSPGSLIRCGDRLFFTAYRPSEGEELWVVNPGRAPAIVKNIRDGNASSNVRNLVDWKGMLYFQADDGMHGAELWRSDGTNEGTVMVRDIIVQPYEPVAVSGIHPAEDRLYVTGLNAVRGRELWVLDTGGTGLQLVRDIASPRQLDMRANE